MSIRYLSKAICLSVVAAALSLATLTAAEPAGNYHAWAPTPPMGWNSWDCFATTVTEAQTREQADFMAKRLKRHGWEYIVVDIQWYEPGANGYDYRKNAPLVMDEWGRLLPAVNRFPSAANGAGFKPLADHLHGLGLKFGIHLMRGIPRLAVERNLPVKGTQLRAQDIANTKSICPWNPDMYGVDMSKPGAQEYYDSVFAQIAEWGVDYVKVDDISRPYLEHAKEIEAIRKAIDRTGRPIVLSLSPGETDIAAADHVKQHANLWRISDDFWDNWPALHEQFARLNRWNPHRIAGAWPDADMLPFGVIDLGRRTTRFTKDEQYTVMTLWSIARSPLMHGGDMTKMDDFTLSLLTNDEVLAVNQRSENNRPLFDRDNLIGWIADVPGSSDKYLALFNARERVDLAPGRAAFRSPIISRASSAHSVDIDLDVKNAKVAVFVADPAGDGNAWDHALWIAPRVVMADGSERSLLDGEWTRADAFWSNLSKEKAPGGGPMSVDGKPVARGIGAHAPALIEYALPEGAVRLKTTAALDDAAVKANKGGSIEFRIFLGRTGDGHERPGLPVEVALKELGFTDAVAVRDLWAKTDLGRMKGNFSPVIPWHGAGLFRLLSSPARAIAAGSFNATWDSLKNYQVPDWFRDAKFGIWAHWSAQCVPEQGDWYARNMYLQGGKQYDYHVKTYGHPSKFGFLEIENLWKAEKWEPEKLMALYKRAGAKYFVALANHHDNFDAYDSKYHAWNSVRVGPKKDIVGTWAKVARENGLRFGVSNHSAHAWHWFQPAYAYDVEGALAGVRYDAFTLKKEDGVGKWWEGLDPQDLYTGPNMVMPDGIASLKERTAWHDRNDRRWDEQPPANNRRFTDTWFLRCQDLVDKYRPDLVYFDNSELPLGQAGLDIAAHYYNAGKQWHDGRIETVLNVKGTHPTRRGAVVDDIERGVAEGIREQPWQTDTCIGAWHYERKLYDENKYKTAPQVIRMLVDIVSKNGNLLLSVPMRGDGTIDDKEVAVLDGIARWMAINGEAIFSTRPWTIYGEGPSVIEKAEAGHFGGARDVRSKPYTSEDIRFTQKGGAIYAFVMERPADKNALLLKSFAKNSPQLAGRAVSNVSLLGHDGKLVWNQDEAGMRVQFPDDVRGEHVFVLKIQ